MGTRIKQLREAAGWSPEQLADKVGVTRIAVLGWESGKTKDIRNANLVALAHIFRMSVDELLTGAPPRYINELPATYRARRLIDTESVTDDPDLRADLERLREGIKDGAISREQMKAALALLLRK